MRHRSLALGLFLSIFLLSAVVIGAGAVWPINQVICTNGAGCSVTTDPTTGYTTLAIDGGGAGSGVSTVTGAGTVSCSPTTGAVVCTGTNAVSSVSGGTDISCSPTTGAVSCSVTTVGAPNGGTGATSPTAHTVPIAEGSSAFTFISPSTSGFVLTSNGTSADPSFQAASGGGAVSSVTGTSPITCSPTTGAVTCSLTTPLTVANGGTGRTTLSSGALIGNGTGAVDLLLPGNAGNVIYDNGTNWTTEPLSFNTFTYGGTVQNSLIFDKSIPTPVVGATIATQQPTTDSQPDNMTVEAANAFGSASSNTTGATLSLGSGAGVGVNAQGVFVALGGGNGAGTSSTLTLAAFAGIVGSGTNGVPLQWGELTLVLSGGTLTLSSAQYPFPYLDCTGSLSSDETIVFPTTNPGIAAAMWVLDTTEVTFNSHQINVKNGSGIVSTGGSGLVDFIFVPRANTIFTK